MTLSSPEKACLKAFSYSLSFITKNYLIILGLTICFLFTGCTFFKKPLTPASELKTGKFKPGIKDVFLADLLSRYPEYFDTLIKNNNKWHIKIIYTRIDRKANNRPVFTNYYYNIEPDQYFYPASTVKLPVSILSLQKLHELKIRGLNRATTMITESGWIGQSKTYNDPDASDGRPTIEMYIKKIFLVSDNNAFNRLYEFLGQEYINGRLHKLGFDSTQIVHRLNISLSDDQNRHTNPVIFYDSNSRIIFTKPLEESKMEYQQRSNYLGIGYIKDNELIRKPFDFSKKNRITLPDLHTILETILFPEVFPSKKRFKLYKDDYPFIYKFMSMKPDESDFPQYDTTYNQAYSKLLFYGGKGKMDPDIRIFNKEGDAYGFLNDIAYIVDFKNNIEFILSASIYCNSDNIFNDDKYDYESVGYPFLKNLGHVIYDYEISRKRRSIPDLSKFKLSYSR